MRNVKSAVHRSLHGSEDASTCRGSGETDVQVAAEGSGLSVHILHVERITVNFRLTLVDAVQTQLLQ